MVAQTDGSTQGSLVGAIMIVVAFVLLFTVLTVTREELALARTAQSRTSADPPSVRVGVVLPRLDPDVRGSTRATMAR